MVQKTPFLKPTLNLLLATALFWLPALLFIKLANEVLEREPLPGDIGILLWIHQFATPLLDTIMLFITSLGGAPVVVPSVLVATIALALRQHKWQALFLLVSAGGTAVINLLFKLLFQRERPALWHWIVAENGYSFPSGHAMMSSALALSIILLCWYTRLRWLVVTLAASYFLLIGFSRLYLGVHYPSDIVGGWIVSFIWVLVVYQVLGRYGHRLFPVAR